jgi:hypothetical protein
MAWVAAMPKPSVPAPQPERANRSRQLSELLPDIGRTAFRKFGFVQSSIITRWSEIVGEKYARVSAPDSIRFPFGERTDGTLTLTVSGAHATMMQHIGPEIIERVNRFFGYTAVARIVIRQGEVKRRVRVAPPVVRAVPVDLGDSLRTIADPELKAVLEGLAAGVGATAMPKIGKIS